LRLAIFGLRYYCLNLKKGMRKVSFVCFSINNWEKRKARKQQFMLHLSYRDDVDRVLYIEPALNIFRLLFFPVSELRGKENRKRWFRALSLKTKPISDKFIIITPLFFIPFAFRVHFIYNLNLFIILTLIRRKIKKIGLDGIVLWLYHPFDYPLLKWFKEKVFAVFDWAEEWADYFVEYSSGKKDRVRIFEERIVRDADLVFVVSEELLRLARENNPNSYQLLDGTDYELFQRESGYTPYDIRGIRKPILGYLGTIKERTDLELVKFIAKSLPTVSLVFIGDIHYRSIDLNCLGDCENIYFLGGKDYEELGNYAKFFDVCILPYKRVSSPPTKIFDYLATGKPVVSTDLPAMARYKGHILIATNKEEFLEMIKIALMENNAANQGLRRELAKENSWAKRADEIMNYLKKGLSDD